MRTKQDMEETASGLYICFTWIPAFYNTQPSFPTGRAGIDSAFTLKEIFHLSPPYTSSISLDAAMIVSAVITGLFWSQAIISALCIRLFSFRTLP